MARKNKKEKDMGSGYSYMDTYGDMVTLLLTFFVLLFSFSSVDQAKWKLLVESFAGSPPSTPISIEMSPLNMGGNSLTNDNTTGNNNQRALASSIMQNSATESNQTREEVEAEFDDLYATLQAYIQENNLSDQLVAEKNQGTITLRVLDGILFDSGSADIKQSENSTINDIGMMLADSIDVIELIQVEGHTDNIPINTTQFQDNWDLSGKRATNTIRFLNSNNNIPNDKLASTGYGEFKPHQSNDTPEGREQNRRVEFIIERRKVDLSVI